LKNNHLDLGTAGNCPEVFGHLKHTQARSEGGGNPRFRWQGADSMSESRACPHHVHQSYCSHTCIVVDFDPQKRDPNQMYIIALGNLIQYPGKLMKITANLATSKHHYGTSSSAIKMSNSWKSILATCTLVLSWIDE